MADKKGTGLYMVWCDVPADMEDELNRWYNEEHLDEILAIPGVLSAARYVALIGSPKYLACYELANPEVLSTPEFQVHRDHPTEWSKKVDIRRRATRFINNNYRQIFPPEVSQGVAQSGMAPVLQMGRQTIPEDQEDEWNNFYNTVYAPNYEQVPGCIRFRRYRLHEGPGPKYSVVYEFEHEEVPKSAEWFAAREKSGGALPDTYPRMVHDEGSAGVYKRIFLL